jgi:hypothetical protein
MDGVCLIERIDLPDRRTVIACIQIAGNPGNSITNSVEYLYFQVCKRFDLRPDRVVWLEHYDFYQPAEWNLVTFVMSQTKHPFYEPEWTPMTNEMWRDLRLRAKKTLNQSRGEYDSKIKKLFPWPKEAIT